MKNVLVSLGLSLLALGPLLLFGPYNVETHLHGLFATLTHANALWDGRYLFWSDALALGVPLPLGSNLNYHPLFLLSPVLPYRVLLSTYWLVHLSLASFYILRLCKILRSNDLIAAACAFCFVLSAATLNYTYTDDWVEAYLVWTMYPLLVYYTYNFAARDYFQARYLAVTRLALLVSFTVLNASISHGMPAFAILGVLALLLCYRSPRLLLGFAIVAILVALMISEHVYHLASEISRFPDGLKPRSGRSFSVSLYIEQLMSPLALLSSSTSFDLNRTLSVYLHSKPYFRVPFLGLVFFVSAVLYSLWPLLMLRRRPRRTPDQPGPETAFAVCFVLSVVCSLLPGKLVFDLPSGMWTFRDPMIVFGLLVAGCAMTRLLEAPTRRSRALVWFLVLFQLVQVTLVALPAACAIYERRNRNAEFYTGSDSEAFASWFTGLTQSDGYRVYLSPYVASRTLKENAWYASQGIFTAWPLSRLGVRVLNGNRLKGVSTDQLHPSPNSTLGAIKGQYEVMRDVAMLDALSARWVLVEARELASVQLRGGLPGLVRVGSYRIPQRRETLVLFRNPTAWPMAVVTRPEVAKLDFAKRPGCSHQAFLCADLRDLGSYRLLEAVDVQGSDDDWTFSLLAQDTHRALMVSMSYREEWTAKGDGVALPVRSVGGVLLAIEIPPGVSSVSLRYLPVREIQLLIVALGVGICCLFVMCVLLVGRKPSSLAP
jgi:hypothetical protein